MRMQPSLNTIMKNILALSGLVLLASTLCIPALHAEDAPLLSGRYALQGGKALTGGHLRVTPVAGNPLKERLDLWMTLPSSEQPIRQYSVEMTKKLHVVIVSADFSTFLHIHPTLDARGHFLIDQQFPAPGPYLVYADGLPNNMDHQVFRFDITVGGNAQQKPKTIAPTGREVNIGPYTVDLSQVRLSAGGMDSIDVHILKGDKPANDLHPYLGVDAHAVFLNSQDLTYVHVHPMAMGSAMAMMGPGPMQMSADLPENSISSPDMMLHISIKEPGTYKMWLQFRGGDQLYVAPFILTAQ
jgi:hypothetical protein